jgi:Ion channel
MTIATVGYGDIVVTINSAKTIAAILSIIGVVIDSQLIMALS